jgi:uncharacterized membrane protein
MKTFRSNISNQEFPVTDKVSGKSIRQSLLSFIQKDKPDFTAEANLSFSELNQYREKYIADCLIKETGELSDLEKTVLNALTDQSTLTDKIESDERKILTTGQRLADKVASFGGSWTFIILFGLFILIWISINTAWLANRGFDPFPFILLNLLLSCIAAIQAPVIMMSQNRQEEKDRDRAKKDYMINLKSEVEIRTLNEKIDHLIMKQQQELLEIQRVQIEMLSDILNKVDRKS